MGSLQRPESNESGDPDDRGSRAGRPRSTTAPTTIARIANLIIGAKDRIEGVTLRATDTDWQHGAGPEVSGPILALVVAMCGRRAALDDLTGDGVAVLRARN